ncbi:MAG: D-glycero-beta-D-manno-heptose 1-phosphate adenylyltransferase [Calditrichaeota bacterium]|nr:MAG: D-glycero-beta-D-manno-heptose 1-phosphate adenylyltransferase [Calditrichota bacterium]MBL1204225.1 D-glycero-beta-D-manno-heptose 1-phosphate adenylyltransferase [Calditrichota bacterium]NOG44055.1 D-glycero-beta-D-manno-heptose 1-phosphate adenylyltransferase [Calditrichota bacterium]
MNTIVTIDNIKKVIAELRKKGLTIAFTNGCFDLLHRGHVYYLEKAKQKADILVLGLNSDSSVQRLKGADRPLVKEEDRAFVLSRLESVDVVCLFAEDTPIEIIKIVKPDFLIKGGDYSIDQIIGHEFVQKNGGKVLTIPLVEGKSTTKLIDQISNQ